MLSAPRCASLHSHPYAREVKSFLFAIMLVYASLAILWSLSFAGTQGAYCYT